MTAYALQSPPHAGAQVTWTNPPANGDTVVPGTKTGLLIYNGGGGTVTVSIPLPTSDGQTVTARLVTLLTLQTWLIPLPSSVYGTSAVTLTYTGTLTLVYAANVSIP